MSDPAIRIGIIGAGGNATGHARFFHEHPQAQITGVADINEDLGGKLAGEVGARHVTDYRDLFDEADAIVVASPNFLHREQAVAAAEAGKHVYCEKPMGLSYTDARAISDAIAKAGVRSSIGFSVRWGGATRQMIKMSQAGEFGDIISAISRRMMYLDPNRGTGWRGDHSKSGGLLLEINVHELDWLMAVGGDVSAVNALMHSETDTGPRANDHVWFLLEFAKSGVGMHEGSWLAAAAAHVRAINGTKGGATTDEWGQSLFRIVRGARERLAIDVAGKMRGDEVFLNAILNGDETEVNHLWGLKVMRVAEAIFRSAKQKRRVEVAEIDPDVS